jgi:hypothetical protein
LHKFCTHFYFKLAAKITEQEYVEHLIFTCSEFKLHATNLY